MKPTILVVDDQPGTRRFLRQVLQGAGYAVIEAEDKATAWEAVWRHPSEVSLALIDIELLESGGRQVAETLQVLCPLRVVFISGHDRATMIADGRLPSDALFISKPFTIRGVLDAVAAGLNGSALVAAPSQSETPQSETPQPALVPPQ